MRTIVVLLPFLLAACAGDPPPPAPSPSPASALAQACPRVEQVLQHADVTSAASRHRAAVRLRDLAEGSGDPETEDALAAVVRGLQRPHGWARTFGDLASACAAAGSPVFD